MGLFSLSDLEYMFWAAIRNGSIGTIGAKGDPGGLTTTQIGAAHLDTIVAPGAYGQGNGALVTTASGYPITNNAPATLLVLAPLANVVVQEFQFGLGTLSGRIKWSRQTSNTGVSWSTWKSFTGTRMDQTAGRVLYQWDELNNREQLVYGDTGWRDIGSMLDANLTTTRSVLRRYNNTVSFEGRVKLTASGVPSSGQQTLFSVPLGFKYGSFAWLPAGQTAGTLLRVGAIADNIILYLAADSPLQTGVDHFVSAVWTTNDAWPATLPGTAYGSIAAT